MDEITRKAYGKINIGLDVTGRREDGYHLVRMVMQTVDLFDTVTVTKTGTGGGISVSCDDPLVPANEHNIAWKAAAGVLKHSGLREGVAVRILKRIPMAAGMAGGSTDAAAVIEAMDELFGLDMGPDEKDRIAVQLGADVPFCLRQGTYLSEGIGEILTPLPDLPVAYLLLVHPSFEISTKWSYGEFDRLEAAGLIRHPDIDGLCGAIAQGSLDGIAGQMGNVLEQVAEQTYPQIGAIREIMMEAGAVGSRMTGSGPTVFGLFEEEKELQKAEKYFEEHPECGHCFQTAFMSNR